MISLIDKEKIRADDYISGFLVISYMIFAVFFRFETLMSVIIYPLVALFFNEITKIVSMINKRRRKDKNLKTVLFGIISIFFSIAFLEFIITQPNVSIKNIINLAAFPIVIVGFAGIIKGIIIRIYSRTYRTINIIVGAMTIIISILVLLSPGIFPPDFILFHIISLSIALLVNIFSRAALYLSEFGLSLLPISNFKLFFYIISDYLIFVNKEGNIILDKID